MGSELGDYARELLRDGQWHDYRVIVTQLAIRVQPGRAVRRAESQRRTAGREMYGGRENTPPRKVHADDAAHQIRVGSRHIAKQVLNRSAFEIKPHGQVPPGVGKFVRLRRQEHSDDPRSEGQ